MTDNLTTLDQQNEAFQEHFWASRLVECMLDLGELKTNAVLISLDGIKSIKPYQRYPEKPYNFGNKHWRAFYHCHDKKDDTCKEHGHYHFFTHGQQQDSWSHVAAMGMNKLGQPVRLFTTNLWVTDGIWFKSNQLKKQMEILRHSKEDTLVSNWLKSALLLFYNEINNLLLQRDEAASRLYPNNLDKLFSDHDINYLSEINVDLNEQLLKLFNPETTSNKPRQTIHDS